MQTQQTTTLGNMIPIHDWQPIADGIWSCELGDMSREHRYTDLAAEPPKLDAINALTPAAFPFAGEPPSFLLRDGKVTANKRSSASFAAWKVDQLQH